MGLRRGGEEVAHGERAGQHALALRPARLREGASLAPFRCVGASQERTGPRARDHQRQRAALEGRALLPALLPQGRDRGGLRRHGDRRALHAAGRRRLLDRERGRPAAVLRFQAGGRAGDGLLDVGPRTQRNPLQGPRRAYGARVQHHARVLQEPRAHGESVRQGRVPGDRRYRDYSAELRGADRRSEKELLQARAGGVRRRGEAGDHLWGLAVHLADFRVRRFAAELSHRHDRSRGGVRNEVGEGRVRAERPQFQGDLQLEGAV